MRFKEAPNISWISPWSHAVGEAISYQSEIKRGVVLWTLTSSNFYRLIFYWRKFATEPGIRDAVVAVLQFSLNFNVRNILIGVLMYTKYAHGQLRWSEKRGTSVFWNMRQLTVKKRNDTSLTHKAKLKNTVCPLYIPRATYIFWYK